MAVEMNVRDGVMTSSPGPTPASFNANVSADVQLFVRMRFSADNTSFNAAVNWVT